MGRKKKHPSSPPRGRRRVGLSSYKEMQLKAQLRQTTPSEPWVEAQIVSVKDIDASGRPIHYRYHDPQVFPPGGDETGMIRCKTCGIFNPPNATERGYCLDHAENGGWGPSPSAVAIQRMQRYYLKKEHAHLAPEDITSLKREIEDYLREQENENNVAK